MVLPVPQHRRSDEPLYMGLRLDADAFFALEDDGHKYELLHGVVVVSPSPRVSHQRAASRLFSAMASFAAAQSAGEVFYETDVRLAANIVYRPDIMFYASGRSETVQDQFRVAPDIAIEFLSGSSRNMDMRTKRDDYEAAGVREYWAIDPGTLEATVFRLRHGKYVSEAVSNRVLTSECLAGFSIALASLTSTPRG